MKNKKRIAVFIVGSIVVLSVLMFLYFNLPKRKIAYTNYMMKVDMDSLVEPVKMRWVELTEDDYLNAFSKKHATTLRYALKIMDESLAKHRQALAQDKIVLKEEKTAYRRLELSQIYPLDTQVKVTFLVKILEGISEKNELYKKFVDVDLLDMEVTGKANPKLIQSSTKAYLSDENDFENLMWIFVNGSLRFEVDADLLKTLDKNQLFEFAHEGLDTIDFIKGVEIEKTLNSKKDT